MKTKTIEERAKGYANKQKHNTHKSLLEVYQNAIKDAYIKGAQYQREIDKLNFEKWYCKNQCGHRAECNCPTDMCFELNNIKQLLWK